MQIFAIVLISLGILSFLSAGILFFAYRIFAQSKNCVAKATASLMDVRHKKDVPVYGHRFFRGPIRVMMRIENYSRGKYQYEVNQKTYTISYSEHATARQMPKFVSVVYMKRFPKLAYVKTQTHTQHLDIYSLASGLLGILFLLCGFSVLF